MAPPPRTASRRSLCCILLFTLFATCSLAQVSEASVDRDCADIKVSIVVVNPKDTGSKGTIEFKFEDASMDAYTIFYLNGPDGKARELSTSKMENLKRGVYDFFIMDKKKKGCIKQLSVTLE